MIFRPWSCVVVESPFKGNENFTEAQHREYLEKCLLDCIRRRETPYASHKMLTNCLNDNDPEERALGIEAGMEMSIALVSSYLARAVFYTDLGWSKGMEAAKEKYLAAGLGFEERKLFDGI